MESPPKSTEKRDTARIMMTLLVAAIVISVGVIGFVLYSNSHTSTSLVLPSIKTGDTVSLNYIGRLADGRVFDTSIQSVAFNNALYPKSLTFTARANTSYKPFNMTAGNYGSGGTIKGFAMGVIGLRQGDTRIIDVKPGDGYPVDPSSVQTVRLQQEIPVLQSMTDNQFLAAFGAYPIVGQTYSHYLWGWEVLVVSDTGGIVYMRQDPYVGEVIYPYGDPNSATNPHGWAVTVESYDPTTYGGLGSIIIKNGISQADVYKLKGQDPSGNAMIISGYNSTAGTFQVSLSNSKTGYNAELAGRELFFEVTIVSVTPK